MGLEAALRSAPSRHLPGARHLARFVWVASLSLGSAACAGQLSGDSSASVPTVAGAPGMLPGMGGTPGLAPASVGAFPVMRRLTSREYDNTVRDLLGDDSHPALAFDPDATAAGFDNQVDLLGVSPSRARQYWNAADQLAQSADLRLLTSCDATQSGDEACAEQLIKSVGKRAFRRPLVAEEVAILLRVYALGKQGEGHEAGLRQVLKALLVMPPFLYRLDVTPGAAAVAGTKPTDPYQLASRLSYTLVQSMPDAALMAAADAGQLASAEHVASQVARLMADPRAQAMSQDFYERWLGLGALRTLSKSAMSFPAFGDALRAALQLELNEFLKHTLWNRGGAVGAFFSADYSFRNQLLSEHYADSTASGETLTLTQLDPTRSAGILTLGGLMSLLSTPEHTDPVRRGKFIRERLLCQTVPPPPPGVVAAFPAFDANLTTRQRFATHQSDPACAACHRMMDSIGLGFESFDAVGVFRSEEQGMPIDASGELLSSDVDGPFVGPRALAEKLASSQQVQDCLAKTWFRFIAGREAGDGDQATLDVLRPALATSGQKSWLEGLTQTPAFLTRHQEDLQ